MKTIKSLLLIAAAMFTTASYAQVDSPFSFVDKDGNQYDPYAEDFAGNDGLTEIKTGGFTTTEAKSITIKVVNKQEQDENGNMKVFFEYTVPLD